MTDNYKRFIRRAKVESYTLNTNILRNFTYNMEQSLESDKGH